MKTTPLSFLMLALVACASTKKVEPLARSQEQILLNKVQELEDRVALLNERLELIQLSLTKNSEPSKTIPTRPAEKKKLPPSEARQTFMGLGDPELKSLQSNVLTNEDLARVDKKSHGDDVTQVYSEALSNFQAGRMVEARKGFENFVRTYPRHSHAGKALFWIGQSYFDQKEFESAIRYFDRVVREYPTTSKVPDALFAAGTSYLQLSKQSEARHRFQQLVETFPNSVSAQKAKDLLERT